MENVRELSDCDLEKVASGKTAAFAVKEGAGLAVMYGMTAATVALGNALVRAVRK